jgi:hypothetical protein
LTIFTNRIDPTDHSSHKCPHEESTIRMLLRRI